MSSSGDSPSFAKIRWVCFSTPPSETDSASAMAALDLPSAISESTSRSRGVRSASGSRLRPISWRTTIGSSTVPPAATACTAPRKSSRSLTRSLSR